MPAELETPPAETKPNFLQAFAASRPKNEAELKSGVIAPPAPAAPPAQSVPPEKAASAPLPAKPAATTTPVADPDDEIISGKRSPKSEDFRRVKTRATEAQKLADELKSKLEPVEKELTELKKNPKHNSDLIKTIEKERDEYKAKHDAFIVQFTPEFQQKFDTQIAGTLDTLKTLMPADDAAKVAQILQLPDSEYKRKMIAEATETLDAYTVAEVANVNREVRRLNNERKEAMTKATSTLSSIAEERQKQSKEAVERSGKAFEETFKKFTEGESAIPVFQKRDDDKEWNKGVEERERVARVIFNGEFESDSDKAEAAAWSAAAPGILAWAKNSIAAKDAELAEAKATIERLQGSSPAINGGKPADAGGQKTTFLDRMRQNSIQ